VPFDYNWKPAPRCPAGRVALEPAAPEREFLTGRLRSL
jgi:hypothetical protein